jgi:hypothetical protein
LRYPYRDLLPWSKEKGSKRYDAASFDPAQLGFLTKRPVIGGVREKVPPQFGRRRRQHNPVTIFG